jgi:endoglucanase
MSKRFHWPGVLLLFLLGIALFTLSTIPIDAKPLPYTGVVIAGGDFYHPVPGRSAIYGQDYSYPTNDEIDYFAEKGMNIIRVPFLWETLQPSANQPLRQDEVDRLKSVVREAKAHKMIVLLDPHNYARYYGKVVGGPDVPINSFADFWGRLAPNFAHDDNVWFGLVNEPHDMPTEQWLQAANAAIAAIRASGAKNRILVPGNSWTGAWTWSATWYGTPNSTVMRGVRDPLNNFVFEVHQYLDSDGSGTHATVVSPTIGSERLKSFTEWCRANHQRAFLGEFAAGNSPDGQAAIEDMLNYMEKNRDVWMGFTWWAAGARWGNYMFSLEPKNGQDSPQMAWLIPHLQHPNP